ncbi:MULTISPECIES: hypothetical protein [unclassified Eikenella]|nr:MULTISPECIES: hypothetical protein [unclassified Eikenella]
MNGSLEQGYEDDMACSEYSAKPGASGRLPENWRRLLSGSLN